MVAEALPQPDTNLIIAALLHDVIEDADVTASEVTELFGADVTSLVLEVTDDKSLPKAERKRLQVVNAPKKSKRAQMIKIADKISNLKTMISSPPAEWTLERRREYFHWAQDVVNGLSSPNPALKSQFEEVVRNFHELVGDPNNK